MSGELLQSVIDIVFKGTLLYLSPVLFLLMVVLFADKVILLVYNTIDTEKRRRT